MSKVWNKYAKELLGQPFKPLTIDPDADKHVPRDELEKVPYGVVSLKKAVRPYLDHVKSCHVCKCNIRFIAKQRREADPICRDICPVPFKQACYFLEQSPSYSILLCQSPIICHNNYIQPEHKGKVCFCYGCEKPLKEAPCDGKGCMNCGGPRDKLCEASTRIVRANDYTHFDL
ncbi:MAG: hypothetical protein UU65_C0002G0233 [candidate division CPR2 bacterium GW2011_GWC1_41_48]|uniref:Uncharacterized protein n=1 Tax=candidate division CPR2 bacterium GW2011_GWC1_41_48 TaxID=1618344 RepID=A0A0G0W8Z3_UNCC2|nr:MAG: hypothetical protein UT47_C0002G0071 [candidate division CPR2 bacterium GW2011_GWC2_39_35]KKR28958.1 MAG: hypothetical protein UT60_C0008G0001 [candidate division CPR2 bacterium GW2011_GWD2_39_7]KKS09455.1 MAG: hypothetical protein UU65_C0002G0233 [candidate division CPR2 bacterium GW2011_GWC1_41_48]OGB70359.1 MAG: hypothetical protein A2Y26_00075 [candidate division CPR2 bacterium GWD2_39_7]